MKNLNTIFHNQKLNRKFTAVIILFTIIPFMILSAILFYLMERNVIEENESYMKYSMQRNQEAIVSKIDAINMSTQFFLSDDGLWQTINEVQSGGILSVEQWLVLKKNNILSLERLVNSNPLLYCVRVYAQDDRTQEMMPILYQRSRLEKQEWAVREEPFGWNYNYVDNIFDDYIMNQDNKLIGLVTPVYNEYNTLIGTIEAAMTMKNMFPSLYENIDGEWSFFYTSDGAYYANDEKPLLDDEATQKLIQDIPNEKNTETIYKEISDKKLIVSYMTVNELGGTLVCIKDITAGIQDTYRARTLFFAVMLIFIIVAAIFINSIVRHMLKHFYVILDSIRKVQKGDLDVVIENCAKDEMGELGTQINKMLSRIKELMNDNLNREMLVKNSEIKALQNQINAHFIYNVLESIKMMAEIQEEYDISDAVTALGKLLRYSMKWISGNVRVAEELEYIRNYMTLINLRFDYEIYLSLNIPDLILKQEIPKMSLQPIVENAIYHGIEQMAEDSNIYIKGIFEGGDCIIEITDMGRGMSEEEIERLRLKIAGELDSNGGSGNGIGLKNVQDRMHIAFGEGYGIEIASKLSCYTKIMVRIPITHVDENIRS